MFELNARKASCNIAFTIAGYDEKAHRQLHPPPNEAERNASMTLSTESMDGGITRVILDGRLDIEGAAAIDLKMNVLAGSSKFLLVDLRNVSFIGSMGLRSIVVPAQAMRRRGGKMALLAPVPMVEEVLKASNIHNVIPIVPDLESAAAVLC